MKWEKEGEKKLKGQLGERGVGRGGTANILAKFYVCKMDVLLAVALLIMSSKLLFIASF